MVYLWANSPPTVLPIEVSDELYNDDAEYAFQHAEASDCVGNYTAGCCHIDLCLKWQIKIIGAFGCVQIAVQFKGKTSEGWLKVKQAFSCKPIYRKLIGYSAQRYLGE